MKLFYAVIIWLMVLVSACAQQPSPTTQAVQPAQPQVQPVEEQETEAAEEAKAEVAEEISAVNEVRILANGAFDPDALSIKAGDSVTWINTHSKDSVIIIFKDGRTYQNSKTLRPGDKFEHEFKSSGSYQFWRNIAFAGDAATINVQ